MKKRIFQVFDEMSLNDEANGTSLLGACYDFVSANKANGGGHVTMGVPAEVLMKILNNEYKPMLILLDYTEYKRLEAIPLEDKLQAAEAKAQRYEKALKEIGQEVAKAEKESIFVDEFKIRTILATTLTPKTSTDEHF